MPKEIPMTKARYQLTSLPKLLAKEPEAVYVTRRNKPVLAILPWELYESLVETLEIMGDPELMARLRQALKEIKEGKGIPWEKVKKDLKL